MLRLTKKLLRTPFVGLSRSFGAARPTIDNFLSGENAIYAEQMFLRWQENRSSVHASWDAYFTNLSNGLESESAFALPPLNSLGKTSTATGSSTETGSRKSGSTQGNILQEKLAQMILRYRRRAHEVAQIDPLGVQDPNKKWFRGRFIPLEQNPAEYGFSAADLNKPIEFYSPLKGFHESKRQWTPVEVSELLKNIYSGPISFEYMHLRNPEMQDWIREKIEKFPIFSFDKSQKEKLLDRILESQAFTDFCEKKYSSSKRFGIDGLDSAISGMEHLVDYAKTQGVQHIVMGMAHRGRLNTLACVMDMPYEAIFTQFRDPGLSKKITSAEWGFSGDVKYHLGASSLRTYEDGSKVSLVRLV